MVHQRLDAWGLPDDVAYRAQIVATELASNALRHAAPPYRLQLSATERGVRIAVHDSLAIAPSLRQYDLWALTGRGLHLVAESCTSWGVNGKGDGKEVWAEVPLVEGEGTPSVMETSGQPHAGVAAHPSARGPLNAGAQGDPLDTSEANRAPSPQADTSRVVRFLGVPVDAYLGLQEWNDAVIRECQLIAAVDPLPAHIPARLLELALRLSGHFASQRDGYRDVMAQARADGVATVELRSAWPPPSENAVATANAFLAMMEELDGFCRADILLSGPPPPTVVRLRRWFVTEMRAQMLDHAAPIPFQVTS